MHKLFLTEQEAAFICGSQEIIDEIGGFPSMENAKIEGIVLAPAPEGLHGITVSIVFDIRRWAEISAAYGYLPTAEFPRYRIRLTFCNVRLDSITPSHLMDECGDLYFGNGAPHHRDSSVFQPIVVEPPFGECWIRYPEHFHLIFDPNYCIVDARFEDKN